MPRHGNHHNPWTAIFKNGISQLPRTLIAQLLAHAAK
jgi:hypothetical protein